MAPPPEPTPLTNLPGGISSSYRDFVGYIVIGGEAYFTTPDPISRTTVVWQSDGTAAGTKPVIDAGTGQPWAASPIFPYNPGTGTPLAINGQALAYVASKLYSVSNDTATLLGDLGTQDYSLVVGNELFAIKSTFVNGATSYTLTGSNGTASGTLTLATFSGGAQPATSATSYIAAGGKWFFTATGGIDSGNEPELWVTDGTAAGTKTVGSFTNATGLGSMTALGSRVVFTVTTSQGEEVWSSDGTASGTVKLAGFSSALNQIDVATYRAFAPLGGQLLFQSGTVLWQTDGTAAGTASIKDVGVQFDTAAALGGELALGGPGQLWVTDGTAAGTSKVADVNVDGGLFAVGGKSYFLVYDGHDDQLAIDLWVTDGTSAGTTALTNISGRSFDAEDLTYLNGMLYFFGSSTEGVNGFSNYSPWASDGTSAGTGVLANVIAETQPNGFGGLNLADQFQLIGSNVVLMADDGFHGVEPWVVTPPASLSGAGGLSLTATEGAMLSQTVGTFTDPNGAGAATDYTATINWGDNTTVSTASISGPDANGVFTVTGSHAYAEETSSADTLAVVLHRADAADVTVTDTVNVADAPLSVANQTLTAQINTVLSGALATFTDPGGAEPLADYSATVDWGDGSGTATGAINGPDANGVFTISGSHAYTALGTPTITITLHHDAVTPDATIQDPVTVNNGPQPMNATAAGALAATEGAALATTIATFTDPNGAGALANYSVTVDWGDGDTNGTGTVSGPDAGGVFTVTGSHMYAEETASAETINIVMARTGFPNTTVSDTVNVADAPLSLSNQTLAAQVNAALSGTLATFTDPGGAEALADYSATVDWGDGSGTTTGAISGPDANGLFTISGSHTYAAVGTPTITLTVHHDDVTPDATVQDQVTVSAGPPAVIPTTAGALAATEGAALNTTLANFTDPSGAGALSTYSATISWGDGASASNGAISGPDANGVFTVTGSHAYAEESATAETISVVIARTGSPSATVSDTVNVADAPLAVDAKSLTAAANSAFSGTLATFTDPGGAEPLADYSATVDWGDGGSATAGDISGPDANGVFAITGSHTYTTAGAASITITLHHDAVSTDATVHDAVNIVGPVTYTSQGGEVTVQAVNGNLQILSGTTVASTTPLTDVTAVTINGATGTANLFKLDYTGGTFVVPGGITFNGGSLPATPSNSLSILGGSFDVDRFNFQSAHDGSITLGTGGQVVNYTNMTPLTNTGTAAQAIFTLPDGTVVASLDAGSTAGTVQLVSGNGTFETTTFPAPSQSLTVNSGSGSDTVTTTNDFYNNFNANLTVQGAANTLPVHVLGAGTLTATEGAALTQTLATFSDPNGAGAAGDYSATIDWGDGNSGTTGTITGPDANGLFTIAGSHAYAAAGATPKTVSVVVHRANATDVTVTDTASVVDASLSGTATSVTATAQSTFAGAVATFTDGNVAATADDFTATIDWGDGATTPGSVSAAGGGGLQVTGSHAYAKPGAETITVVVNDLGGSSATITSAATVAAAGTPHQLYVTAVYEDVLDRAPDADGLAFWANLLDQGTAISRVAESIAHSAEYYANFVIKPDYLALLGRAADTDGVQYWTTKMQAGLTDQQLEAQFAAADEFYTTAGGTDVKWIDAIYKLLLGRPSAVADETFWSARLSAGNTRLEVAEQIAGSQENNTQLINDDYFHYLGRAADADGLGFWLGQFADGKTNEDVISGFTGSAEYYEEKTS